MFLRVQQEDETGEEMFEIKEMKVGGWTRTKWNKPWVFLWWNTLPPPPPPVWPSLRLIPTTWGSL